MSTDRELIGSAAKAAGLNGKWRNLYKTGLFSACMTWPAEYVVDGKAWNPLTDDGDALRLAVKLNLFDANPIFIYSLAARNTQMTPPPADPYAATRLAIVRAAAAMDPGAFT